MNRILAASLLLFSLVLTGCASTLKMPLNSEDAHMAQMSAPIYLLSVSVANSYMTRYQPEVKVVHVSHATSGKEEVLGFKMDSDGTYTGENDDQPAQYLVRLQLAPGTYTILGMYSMARAFPIVGSFYIPVHAPLVASGNGVTYIGHLTATVRERKGSEFKAGPSIPLIDQAIAGASGGTFDVAISDQYENDTALYRKLFPALADQAIGKAVLPPFDRARAQSWWEAH